MKTGIPFGPVDFLGSRRSIILLISSGFVGERKNVSPSGLMISFPFGDAFMLDSHCNCHIQMEFFVVP